MNVLYIHRTKGQGVEGVHIWGIVDSLRKLGHNVTLLSPTGEQSKLDHQQTSGISKSGKLHNFISKNTPEFIFELTELLYNLFALVRFFLRYRNEKFDLIYERYAIFSIVGIIISRLKRIPIILEVNYVSRTPLIRKRSKILSPVAFLCDKFIVRRVSGFVAISGYIKKQIMDLFSIKDEKIVILPNGADPDLFSADVEPVKELLGQPISDKLIVGFVGGFYKWHGIDFLVSSFSHIHSKYNDCLLVLIGDGPERQNIQERVVSLGLTEDVLFLGKISHGNLPKYIASFDIGVMPDSNEYGSPVKIFEYMAQGIPVVAPDYGPIHESYVNGVQGFIFKRKDPDSFKEIMIKALSDIDKLKTMGHNARQHILKERNWMNNTVQSLKLVNMHKSGEK